jgi:hypothetical protein
VWPAVAAAQQAVVPDDPSKAPKSQFLQPPGSATDGDRYGPKVDWAKVPPWKQTSFYGIRAQGKMFIFVVDCSGSMDQNARLVRAKREIRRAVSAMQFPQKFLVIFYNDEPLPMPGGLPQSANLSSTEAMLNWFRTIDADGGTDPRAALAQAISLQPDAVFLLSDGEFPRGTVEAVAKSNPKKIPIHCVDLAGGAAGDHLKRIAKDSAGQYVSRPE